MNRDDNKKAHVIENQNQSSCPETGSRTEPFIGLLKKDSLSILWSDNSLSMTDIYTNFMS